MLRTLCSVLLLATVAMAMPPSASFHDIAKARIEATQYALSQPILPSVPGLDAHQAAEAMVLAAMGRVPGSIVHMGNEARVAQAEADLLALQAEQARLYNIGF